MKLDFVYGVADEGLAKRVNDRLSDGWHIFAPPEYHWSNLGALFISFIFTDDPNLALYEYGEPPARPEANCG